MASTTSGLLLFSIVIAVHLLSTASARPCKTIFFITSSSSSHQNHHLQLIPNPNPNPNPDNSPRLTFFVTEIRTRSFPRPMLFDRSITSSSSSSSSLNVGSSEPYFSSSSVKASIRERTMDIMSIVGAVLFGVGCGALTAATMYLFWSLFAPRRFEFCSDSEESGDDENDVVRGNEEDGYFAVPTATKPVPPSADEVDEAAAAAAAAMK